MCVSSLEYVTLVAFLQYRTELPEQILAESANVLPLLSSHDHGILLQYAAIFFLGYVAPSSTGNPFYSLRYVSKKTLVSENDKSPMSDTEAFLSMDILERLENSCKFYDASGVSDFGVCPDPHHEQAFQTFIREGIVPLLSSRPVHWYQTDLLHLIAMAISPQPNPESIPATNRSLSGKSAWQKTERLMKDIHAHSWDVQYHHRLGLVQALMSIALPEPQQQGGQREHDSASASQSTPLLDGAIPHLRAALHSFAASARSHADAHLAHRALVCLVVQTGQDSWVQEEWNFLLRRTVQDYSPSDGYVSNGNDPPGTKSTFCPHKERCALMERFICTFNGARHYADEDFTEYTMASLEAALRQVKGASSTETKEFNLRSSPCLLAQLLKTARTIFYFILHQRPQEHDESDKERPSEDDSTTLLLQSAIQMLHHPHNLVRENASNLLSLAFSYDNQRLGRKLLRVLLQSLRTGMELALGTEETETRVLRVEGIATTASRHSKWFAAELLDFFLSTMTSRPTSPVVPVVARLVCQVGLSRPEAVAEKMEEIVGLLSNAKSLSTPLGDETTFHLVGVLLVSRQSLIAKKHLVAARQQALGSYSVADDEGYAWRAYKLAKLAIATGNFAFAARQYGDLEARVGTEGSYLWLHSLRQVADAEDLLVREGSLGIPGASVLLHGVILSFGSVSSRETGLSFRQELLRLRLDLLDLFSTSRLIAREVRLTKIIPRKHSRIGLHLHKALSCWYALAARYHSCYCRYGLFLCQQSRSSLRTIHSLCRFLGQKAAQLLGDDDNRSEEAMWPHGDIRNPIHQLKRKVDRLVSDRVDRLAKINVRAIIYTEILEAFLTTPWPFPMAFLSGKAVPTVRFRVFLDPDNPVTSSSPTALASDEELRAMSFPPTTECGTIRPGTACRIVCSGEVPERTMRAATIPFSQMLLWYSVRRVIPAREMRTLAARGGTDDDHPEDTEESVNRDDVRFDDEEPTSLPLPPSGRFVTPLQLRPIYTEGLYRVYVKIGCRDVRCGEWELATQNHGASVILLRVSRTAGTRGS